MKLLSYCFCLNIYKLMAYSALIQSLDRLTVKSVLRGSTSSIAGIIGTLVLVILCLAIYVPPANAILKGNFFESEFYTMSVPSQTFVSNRDFKVAIVFRNKTDNSIANHSEIFRYAYSIAYQLLGDYSAEYYEPMQLCSDDPAYFQDISGFEAPSDCFIFPKYKAFRMFSDYTETQLGYMLWALPDPNPFSSAGNSLNSNEQRVGALLQKYYYIVYFTSKVINADGSTETIMNRYYSTETEPTSEVGTSWNRIKYDIRNTTMDVSVFPWKNGRDVSNLVWMGELVNDFMLDPLESARYGIEIFLTQGIYQLRAFRYYKKVDFLMGIVGGAMLLFYLILWVPFNYINKTIHQIRNAEQLLLVNKGKEEDPVEMENLFRAELSWRYWLSNPVFNKCFPALKRERQLVKEAERELDVVSIIKKLKTVQRTLKKLAMLNDFEPKVLKMKEEIDPANPTNQPGQLEMDSAIINPSENNSMIHEQNILVREEEFEVEEVDDKLGLTTDQCNYVRNSQIADRIFASNVTGLAMKELPDEIMRVKELEEKNKWSARHDEKKKPSMVRSIFNWVCGKIEKFDFFGAKPNLSAGSSASSFVGLCGTLFIVLMTILTLYATLSNANSPQIMILEQFLPEDNFGFSLTPGVDLKFAFCSPYLSYLQGSSRYALFRFFYQNSAGRTYFNPSPLTSNDYALFDLTKETSPVNIAYCFKMEANSSLFFGERALDHGYFGFRMEPYCSSTPQFCQSTQASSNTNFLAFMNGAPIYLFLPENRFNPDTRKFINNLAFQVLNINYFYMNATSMEETLYVDHVQIQDDTKNFFMRKAPTIPFQGIAINPNTPYPLSRMLNSSSLFYELKIRPSSQQINYLVTTPKADTILGIIGGVIVIWYAIGHWLGKVYNNYQVRAAQADAIYAEEIDDENVLMKFIAISPLPACMLPACSGIRSTIIRMRQVDKKILNDLNYLWLVKYVDNIFRLSATLFNRPQEQNLSKVYIKEKIDEAMDVVPQIEPQQRVRDEDLIDFQDKQDPQKRLLSSRKTNKVDNEKLLDLNNSKTSMLNINNEKELALQESEVEKGLVGDKNERFSENYINGHPKPFKLAWLDTFEYPSSLTFKGKREVTSCCGGCCCLILLAFILVVVSFEVGIYFDRSDTKIGMTTSVMQPLANQSDATYNSKIALHTGSDFKLAVTFSSVFVDNPHNVASYANNGLGISVFQKTWRKVNGTNLLQVVEYPMVPCRTGYLTESLSSLIDPIYYANEQFGYCIPDGLILKISGLPEDNVRESFTLSLFNKANTTEGKANLQQLLHNYYPKFHFTVPNKDYFLHTITYEIASIVFDPYNITSPVQQNITLSKMVITYDDQIGFSNDPVTETTYNVNPFQQTEAGYYGPVTETLYYNLTFDNSFFVEHYTLTGDKFYETFGIVGGLIAFFIFGFGCLAGSFNTYRMRYLIGRELYLFEISKKKELRNAVRGKVRKTKEQAKELSVINNLSEVQVLRAYLLSFVGGAWQNYNFDPILRRVTLLQQRVERDISLSQVYKKLHNFRDALNAHYSEPETTVRPADVFLKHIFNAEPGETSLDGYHKLKGYAKKHGWSAYEQFSIVEAFKARVNLRDVFDSAFLNNVFDLHDSLTHVNLSDLNQTVQSSSANSEAMSRAENED